MERLPTEEEINPIPEDLDGQKAVKHFLGKTRQQICDEIAEGYLYHTEDLMFMGPDAFCYYLPAAVNFVLSEKSLGDSDIVNGLTGTIKFRLEYGRDEIQNAFPEIIRFAKHALEHYDEFDLTPDIYSDLRPTLQNFLDQCS
ncbi:hypothetical protein [Lacunimicrobium album]